MLSITSSPTPQISQPFARGRPGGPQQRHTISPVVCAASKEDRQNRGILNDPILEMAVREPVSFLGGIIAGFLALDVTQDPLKAWIDTRAAEAGLAYTAAKERLRQQQQQRSS